MRKKLITTTEVLWISFSFASLLSFLLFVLLPPEQKEERSRGEGGRGVYIGTEGETMRGQEAGNRFPIATYHDEDLKETWRDHKLAGTFVIKP